MEDELIQYLYTFNYDSNEVDLALLEMRAMFSKEAKDKVLISQRLYDPSVSPFIKARLDIIDQAPSLEDLVDRVRNRGLEDHEFLVDYLTYPGDQRSTRDQKAACKAIGMVLVNYPNFKDPKVVFGLCQVQKTWYFGYLTPCKKDWFLHKDKPRSYSSAINNRIAKVLVNLGTGGDRTKTLIDPCCGVGTVLIEGLYSGYKIVGRDINFKVVNDSLDNLKHFNYKTQVTVGDIKGVKDHYHACIIDLPYNILSPFDREAQKEIIYHGGRISDRLVLVSSEDIFDLLDELKLRVLDQASIGKIGKTSFKRRIWICEQEGGKHAAD